MTKSLHAGIEPAMKSETAKYDARGGLLWGFNSDQRAMQAHDAYKLLDQALLKSERTCNGSLLLLPRAEGES